jgi:AcrR family transcriptional regulator
MQDTAILTRNLSRVKMERRKPARKPTRATAGKPPGSYHHRNLRNALVSAGLDLLEREGTDFTLRELARRVGVSHAAPYAHFSDKAALFGDLAHAGFERLGGELSASTATASDARSRLLNAGRAYVHFAFAHPALFRLMFGIERAAAAPAPTSSAAAQAAFEILSRILRELPYGGTTRNPERVRGDAIAAWAQVHGLSLLAIDGHLGSSKRERSALIDGALLALIDGIAPHEAIGE